MTAVALASLGCKHVQWSMLGKILEWLKANNISVKNNGKGIPVVMHKEVRRGPATGFAAHALIFF